MHSLRALLPAALLVAACAGPGQPEPQQTERTPVPDGINDGFLAEDLEVQRFVDRWELESREVYAARADLVAALELQPGEAVADVGTGTGLFVEGMAAAVGPGGKVYAVDISPKFIFHVRERAREAGLDQVEVVLSNDHSTELPADSVDAMFLCDVYHHFEYHRDMLRSMRRALRPGGRLVFVDFHRIPGVSREWMLGHVRADRETFRAELETAGFRFVDEVDVPSFEENYCLRFTSPD